MQRIGGIFIVEQIAYLLKSAILRRYY